jgi:hypothetical protein
VGVQQVDDRLLALAERRVAGAALDADGHVVPVGQRQAAIERVVDVERPPDDVVVRRAVVRLVFDVADHRHRLPAPGEELGHGRIGRIVVKQE